MMLKKPVSASYFISSRKWLPLLSLRLAALQTAKKRYYWTLNSGFKRTSLLLVNSHRYYGASIPADEIENVLNEKNKTRVISALKLMKPNPTLVRSCQSEAAVLVPFCTVNNKPCVLFTLRSSSLFKHRGEVSFPGGKRDKEDESLVETAMRETVEELGINSNQIEIWAPLTPMPDRLAKVAITPVLGFLGEVDVQNISFNHHEVSEVFTLEIKYALEHRRFTKFKTGSRMPVFPGGPHRVWGLTAIITDRVFEILFPGKYNLLTKVRIQKHKH